MDIRELTLNNLSMTKEPAIAKNFAASRSDDGQQYIGTTPTDPISVRTEITYPHNGEKLDGMVATVSYALPPTDKVREYLQSDPDPVWAHLFEEG